MDLKRYFSMVSSPSTVASGTVAQTHTTEATTGGAAQKQANGGATTLLVRKMETGNSSAREEQTNNRFKPPLWNHVDVVDKGGQGGGNVKWICKYCKYVGTSSYSRVRAHLLKITNGGIKVCPKVTVPILAQLKSEVAKAEDEQAKTRPREVPLPPSTVGSETGVSASVSSSSMDSAMSGNKKRRGPTSPLEKDWAMELRNQLDAQIARMFYSGGLSFNLARNPHFQQSYIFAASHGKLAGYVPPGYNKLRTTLLQQERTHIETLLEHTRSTWPEKGVTICSDGWSDAQRRPLINFLAISEGAPMFLRAINAEGEVKTKEYISEKLIAVIEEVGARSVVQVITDNAANCKGAGLIVQQKYTHIFWTPCVVHTLNLALKSICAAKMPRTDDEELIFHECHWITEISEDANMIKNFIMNHGIRLSMFNEFSKLKLLAIAETRFASVVVMLKRFCMVKRALQNMVISDQWETYRDDNRGLAQTIRELVLNDMWWDKVNYIVEFTEPIYELIHVADTDTPCVHLIYEMWDAMIENVKKVIYRHKGKEDNEESTFYSAVQSILVDRWAKGNTPLHCLAYSLNPRYYSEKWISQEGAGVGRVPPHKDPETSQMRMKCFKKFFPVLKDLKKVKEEYARFSTCSGEFNDFDSIYDRWILDPMNWWANHGQSVPVLQSLALKLVNQPASSSCCERNWSTYSFINSMKRNKLTPLRDEDLVFVHNNLRLLSRRTEAYKTGATRMWDVGGDSFESLTGVGILEVAQLSIEEPELESVLFEDDSSTVMIEEENEDEVED